MNLKQFVELSNILNQMEMVKTKLLSFYYLKTEELIEFDMKDIRKWFNSVYLPIPNTSRLKNNIIKSQHFIKGSKKDTFKLSLQVIAELEEAFPQLNTKCEEVVCKDIIFPKSLYENTRGYIESLAKQINASYENNIFDGCAVLMRRLLEILLIHTYEKYGVENEIKDGNGNYFMLEGISTNAKSNRIIDLSRNTRDSLEKYRKIGNFSAHKIGYICKRIYIEEIMIDFRATIEELLYKSQMKK